MPAPLLSLTGRGDPSSGTAISEEEEERETLRGTPDVWGRKGEGEASSSFALEKRGNEPIRTEKEVGGKKRNCTQYLLFLRVSTRREGGKRGARQFSSRIPRRSFRREGEKKKDEIIHHL